MENHLARQVYLFEDKKYLQLMCLLPNRRRPIDLNLCLTREPDDGFSFCWKCGSWVWVEPRRQWIRWCIRVMRWMWRVQMTKHRLVQGQKEWMSLENHKGCDRPGEMAKRVWWSWASSATPWGRRGSRSLIQNGGPGTEVGDHSTAQTHSSQELPV